MNTTMWLTLCASGILITHWVSLTCWKSVCTCIKKGTHGCNLDPELYLSWTSLTFWNITLLISAKMSRNPLQVSTRTKSVHPLYIVLSNLIECIHYWFCSTELWDCWIAQMAVQGQRGQPERATTASASYKHDHGYHQKCIKYISATTDQC